MRAASSAGASLVQAIQHETTATYFILARADGGQLAYLDVDCYTDYRKDNRTWLLADELIANRRPYRDFYLPSIPDEFTYYLLKKVLKQSITPHQLKRLQHLLARNPAECRQRIAKFWPAKAAALQRAIAEHDFRSFRRQLPELYCELQTSRAVEPLLSRFAGKPQELLRGLRRVMRPTGMWVCITGADFEQRRRACRRTRACAGTRVPQNAAADPIGFSAHTPVHLRRPDSIDVRYQCCRSDFARRLAPFISTRIRSRLDDHARSATSAPGTRCELRRRRYPHKRRAKFTEARSTRVGRGPRMAGISPSYPISIAAIARS